MLVQEYCITDLSNLIKSVDWLLPEPIIKGIMQQLLRGLAACHSEGKAGVGQYETL